MSYSYTSPSERPRCWGDSRVYDQVSRECRSCSVQNSCGDSITRARNAAQLAQNTVQIPPQTQFPQYGQSYFAQYAPPQVANPLPVMQPVAQPALVQPLPSPVPRPFAQPQAPTPMPPPITPQQIQQTRPVYQLPTPPTADRYGWLQDPLYFQIASCPPPPRPQFDGENFVSRVGKNVVLDMVESLFKQCLLGVRQLVLPPPPPPPFEGG